MIEVTDQCPPFRWVTTPSSLIIRSVRLRWKSVLIDGGTTIGVAIYDAEAPKEVRDFQPGLPSSIRHRAHVRHPFA